MADSAASATASSTTVVRGARAKKLEDTFTFAVNKLLRSCELDKLTSCFPTLASNDKDVLRDAQEQLAEYLSTNCASEFQKILKERNVIVRLNELDEIVNEAKERRDSGAPSNRHLTSDLPADVVLRAFLLPEKRTELQSVMASIEEVQRTNAESLKMIEQQRKRIELRTREIKDALQTLETVVSSSSSTNASLKKPTQGTAMA